MSTAQQAFVQKEVHRLVSVGALALWRSPGRPHVVSPIFTVPKKSSFPLVTDFSATLNGFLEPPHFRMDTVTCLSLMSRPGDMAVTWDLDSGYHQLLMEESARPLLGIEYGGRFYTWRVLPFGTSSAPVLFHKTVRTVVGLWHSKNMRILSFLDDFILIASSLAEALSQRAECERDMARLGLVRKVNKGMWEPATVFSWLGVGVDTIRGVFFVPDEKMAKVTEEAQRALQASRAGRAVPLLQVARFGGLAVSLSIPMPPARLMCRDLYAVLRNSLRAVKHNTLSRFHFLRRVRLTPAAQVELEWWVNHIRAHATAPIWPPTRVLVCATDASDSGWGGWLDPNIADPNRYTFDSTAMAKARGTWTVEQRARPIAWRELFAVLAALRSFSSILRGHHVRLLIDNGTAAYALNKGGSRSDAELTALAREVWHKCISLRVSLSAIHVRGRVADGGLADDLSRRLPCDREDWALAPDLFARLEARWGPHDVDRFASAGNAKLPRYDSLFSDPNAEAIDAFSVPWHGQNNYVNSPFALISRALQHALSERANCTFVVPAWTAQPWWPTLCQLARDWLELPRRLDTFIPGRVAQFYVGRRPPWRIFAFRITFPSATKRSSKHFTSPGRARRRPRRLTCDA